MWASMVSGTTDALAGAWGSGASNVIAVGGASVIRWNGSTWSSMSPPAGSYNAVWGSAANDISVVGSSGVIIRWNGTAWSTMTSPTGADLYSIYGTGPSDIYATGRTGSIVHWDGYAWSRMDSGTVEDIYSVWASTYVFAGGASSYVYRRVRNCAATETSCSDGADNDCDGRIDCSDTDCSADATCLAGGLCYNGSTAITTLACGTATPGTTVGGPSKMKAYACDDWFELGREMVYKVSRPTAGTIDLTLAGMSDDLDLVVLDPSTASGACEPTYPGCRASRSVGGLGTEPISITGATGGQVFYVIVEGYNSNAGTFTLNVNCP
jgi:hypothetical protein